MAPTSIDPNTLVIVLPKKGKANEPPNPPVACWGLVVTRFDAGVQSDDGVVYKIRMGEAATDVTFVASEQLIPLLMTDGSFSDPQKVFAKNEEKIMLHLVTSFLTKHGVISQNKPGQANLPEPAPQVPIQENTLVIVLPRNDNPPEACWGLVRAKIAAGGNYDVQIGRFKRLSYSRIIAQPDQLIPVYLTDGTLGNPHRAVRALRAQLFLHLLLVFYTAEGSSFLRQIAAPLSEGKFLLTSRRRRPK